MKGYDEKYLQSCIDKAKKSWEGVDTDKFMNEIRGREDAPNEELNKAAEEYAQDETMSGLAERAFKAGAKWQRERMMEDSIDGIARPDDCEIWVNLKGYGYNYKDGDKIKLIIIKEEE